jgi:type IV fimbrial biogenesis protein FimT
MDYGMLLRCLNCDSRRRPFLRGFSLLELLVVITILALLARVTVPQLSGVLVRSRLDAAARRVVSDLSLAQKRARLLSSTQHVTFDAVTDSYQLVGLANSDHPTAAYQVLLGDVPYEAQIQRPNFGGDAEIIFDGYGVPDSGGTVYVVAGGQFRLVTLDAQTGRATVSEPAALPAEVADDVAVAK